MSFYRGQSWMLPEPSDSKIWSWVPRDSEPRMIVLERTSSNYLSALSLSHIFSSYSVSLSSSLVHLPLFFLPLSSCFFLFNVLSRAIVHSRCETLISTVCWLTKHGTEHERNEMISQCSSDGTKYETSPFLVKFMNNSSLYNPNDEDFASRCRRYSLNPSHHCTGLSKVPELNWLLRHLNFLHLHSIGRVRRVGVL
jgi:hypothetical protein